MASSTSDSRPTSSAVSPRPMRSRTQSISSDRPSTISHLLMTTPQSVSPEAAFIAASAASQIVTNDHDSHADIWYDQNGIEPSGEAALVSPAALQLMNNFLDQLLFNFLQVSRATTLTALRPAVSEVLKPKLAKDTINNADEELREYLGGADEDDYVQPQGSNNARDWDVELVWKRTRLRCMVYSSLGDLEEEDEDFYMEQENLEIGANEKVSDVISPAVAIFLTSVLEYMGELTLTVAGQAAYNRIRTKIEKGLKDGTRNPAELADRIVVGEYDMERVALDRTLGRLWRGWKKRLRTPVVESNNRTFSMAQSPREDITFDALDHKVSVRDTMGAPQQEQETSSYPEPDQQQQPTEEVSTDVQPCDIPLPMGENDIEEIEVPWLARYSDDEEDTEELEVQPRRPKSFIIPSVLTHGLPTPALTEEHSPILPIHRRSQSLPTPRSVRFLLTTQSEQEASSGAKVRESADSKSASAAKASRHGKQTRAKVTGQEDDAPWDSDDSGEVATVEKAEIVTSSRVSVASTSSPTVSESGRGLGHHRRSSSVHSARIIDVTGPKSPTASRPPSMDVTERKRSVSLSSSSARSYPFSASELPKAIAVENIARATGAIPTVRSPVDRVRPAIQNASTISESEEEIDDRSVVGNKAAGVAELSRHTKASATDRITSAPRTEVAPATTKVTILKTLNTTGPFVEEPLPEVPRKSPGHAAAIASRGDVKAISSTERSKSTEAEEEMALPLHAIVPPRQIHTSGSSSSSINGRFKAVRTSEEDSPTHADSVARNFEELIQSNQTITYTLTPENMRDIETKRSVESPVVTKVIIKNDEFRAPTTPRSIQTSFDVNDLPPAQRTVSAATHVSVDSKASKPSGPIPRAPAGMAVTTGRAGGPQAREARIPVDSIADFAEFIKSTGPVTDKSMIASRKIQTPTSPTKRSGESRRVSVTSSRSNRSRYQPREAAVDNKADNSDLIDFIRQGPPAASSNHRIPRHVAPFRTTMDSDQMVGAIGGKAIDANIPEIRYSQASTNLTDNSMPSIQSSINSSSALLKNRGSSKASKMMGEDDGMPIRKTRRVRDPYAIDFSDEEVDEEDFMPAPRAPVKREESLAEFLRNYEPPPEPSSQLSSRKVPKKKTSTPSLIGRFTRSNTKEPVIAPSIISSPVSDTASITGRSKHIPIQVNMPPGYDKYGPIGDAVRPRGTPTSVSMNRTPMKRFEPREPVSSSQTSDLAAFLRDSEPPPERVLTHTSHSSSRPEESNSIGRKMFGRRRKTSIV